MAVGRSVGSAENWRRMFSATKTNLILGGPGCGKTSRLIELVEREIAVNGVAPQEIAYVAFTRAAADEASVRTAQRLGLNIRIDLPWFRTIHSLAYHVMGITAEEILTKMDWRKFGASIGETLSAARTDEEKAAVGLGSPETWGRQKAGDVMMRVIDYAETTQQSLDAAQRELEIQIDPWRLQYFYASLQNYKKQFGKMTFTDLLTTYLASAETVDVRVAFIDEGQDLTKAQWQMVEKAFAKAERVYVAGDDDQAIYRWAGADVDYFLALEGTREVLPLSHRLPAPIFNVGQRIVRRISHRFPKDYRPASHPGKVTIQASLRYLDLEGEPGSWMLLARNTYLLTGYRERCDALGMVYRNGDGVSSVNPAHLSAIELWERLNSDEMALGQSEEIRDLAKLLDVPRPALREDRGYCRGEFPDWPWGRGWVEAFAGLPLKKKLYYGRCRRGGDGKVPEPRVLISTIHGVKGGEADNVFLLQDVSRRTLTNQHFDHEHRVFYVGVTRARRTLQVLTPRSTQAYRIQ